MDDESAEIELVNVSEMFLFVIMTLSLVKLEQNLNKTRQISQRMTCKMLQRNISLP